jgi:hypothetical protein
MQHIISASRRTDIPAFYSDWFLHRLEEGFTDVLHPYTKKWFRVSLRAEDVGAIVFWSKNYEPLIPKLEEIEKTTKNLFFHFTITANRGLELRTPDYRDAARDYVYLAKRYAPERLVWRFDPICITDKLPFEIYVERFIACAELLKGLTDACTISFANPYKKVLANMKKYTDHTLIDLPDGRKREYAKHLTGIAEGYGISLLACCNDFLLSDKIEKARCIDGGRLSLLFGTPLENRPAATRKECGCTRSIDIGAYDTCGHGCVYCYANTDQEKAARAPERQQAEWTSLGGHTGEEKEVVIPAKLVPASIKQGAGIEPSS